MSSSKIFPDYNFNPKARSNITKFQDNNKEWDAKYFSERINITNIMNKLMSFVIHYTSDAKNTPDSNVESIEVPDMNDYFNNLSTSNLKNEIKFNEEFSNKIGLSSFRVRAFLTWTNCHQLKDSARAVLIVPGCGLNPNPTKVFFC